MILLYLAPQTKDIVHFHLCLDFRPQTQAVTMVVKNDVVMADEGGPVEVAPPKAGWRSKVPIMACGAGLFSDGYLNGVCEPNPALCLHFFNVHVVLPRLLAWSILYSSGCGRKNMVLISNVLLHLYGFSQISGGRG